MTPAIWVAFPSHGYTGKGEEIKVLNQMICHDPPKKIQAGGQRRL